MQLGLATAFAVNVPKKAEKLIFLVILLTECSFACFIMALGVIVYFNRLPVFVYENYICKSTEALYCCANRRVYRFKQTLAA